MKRQSIIHYFIVAFLLVAGICFCTACDREISPTENKQQDEVLDIYLNNKGITVDKIDPSITISISSADQTLLLAIPKYWQDANLCLCQTVSETDSIIFTLYDSYTKKKDDQGMGRVWALHRFSFADYERKFSEFPLADSYGSVLPAADYIIGTDEKFVYILQLPTDVRCDLEDPLSIALYKFLQSGSQQIIMDFLRMNDIEPNDSCPENECYKVAKTIK